MKLSELVEEYADHELRRGLAPSTVRHRVREVARFFEAAGPSIGLGDRSAAMTREDVREYLAGQCSAGRYNDVLRSLAGFFGLLMTREQILVNPCTGLDFKTRETARSLGIFTVKEIRRLLAVCAGDVFLDVRDRAIVTMLYATGIRLRELALAAVGDVDLRREEFFVRHGKGGRERRVPLGEAAALAIEDYLELRDRLRVKDAETLFVTTTGKPFAPMGVAMMLRRRKKAAGISSPGITHAFRHACATHMLEGGAPLTAVQRLLGHADLGMTARYTHPVKDALAAVHAAAHPKAKEVE